MKKHIKGFTVIELIIIILIISVASVIFFIQKNNIENIAKDNAKKTALNSMYYALEEVFYKENKYYPRAIDQATLRSVDPTLFTDPNGVVIGQPNCAYSYNATDCESEKCQKYILKAELLYEDDYKKTNRN